jgi:hypothetical protein
MVTRLITVLLILLISSNIFVSGQSYVGLRAAVSLEQLRDFQKHFFLDLMKELGSMKIPNQDFKFDIKVGTLSMKLRNILLYLDKVETENLEVSFKGEDMINVKIKAAKLGGGITIFLKASFLPEWSQTIVIFSKSLDMEADVKLGMKPHPQFPDKNTIKIDFVKWTYKLDFVFSFSDSIINSLGQFFDERVKSVALHYLNQSWDRDVIPAINEAINEEFDELPIYVPIFYNTLIDYSLLEPPKIVNNQLILNVRAAFLQTDQIYNQQGMPSGLTILPPIPAKNKGIVCQVSPNTVNTLMYSLFKAGILTYKLEIPNIAEIVPFQEGIFNLLHPANILRANLKTRFGKNTKGEVLFELPNVPVIGFAKKTFSTTIDFRLSFSYEKNGKMIPFVVLNVGATLEAQGQVKENVKIDATIKKFKVNRFSTVTNDLGLILTSELIKFIVQFELTNIVEFVNKKFLSNLTLYIPPILGMNFNNSAARVLDNYIEFELGVLFEKVKLIRSLVRKVVS